MRVDLVAKGGGYQPDLAVTSSCELMWWCWSSLPLHVDRLQLLKFSIFFMYLKFGDGGKFIASSTGPVLLFLLSLGVGGLLDSWNFDFLYYFMCFKFDEGRKLMASSLRSHYFCYRWFNVSSLSICDYAIFCSLYKLFCCSSLHYTSSIIKSWNLIILGCMTGNS